MYKCKHGASFLSNMFWWSRSDFEESLDDFFIFYFFKERCLLKSMLCFVLINSVEMTNKNAIY